MLGLVYSQFCRPVKVNLSWAGGLAPADNLVRDLTIGLGGVRGSFYAIDRFEGCVRFQKCCRYGVLRQCCKGGLEGGH